MDNRRGKFSLGELPDPLRNGKWELVLCWEARLLPVRVCEGGGSYSAHPTDRAWEIRRWMEHKGQPGYDWPKVASFRAPVDDEQFADSLREILVRELRRHGFKRQAEKLLADAPETPTHKGTNHE